MAMSRAGRRRLILVGAIVGSVGLAAGVYGVRQAQLSRSMQTWLEQGRSAYEQGDYETALRHLNKYVSRDRTDADVLLEFADARRHVPEEGQRHLSHAVAITQAALALEPESLEGQLMLMELYSALGLTTEARGAAERVLELRPASVRAHQVRIESIIRTGRAEEVRSAAIRLAEAAPEDLDVQREALGYLVRSEWDLGEAAAFVDEREARFEPQLGTELMRLELLAARLRELSERPERHAEREALAVELLERLRAAAEMEPRTVAQAEDLMRSLDQLRATRPLGDRALERLMAEPRFAPALAALAAERFWADDEPERAGQVIAENIPDLAKAEHRALGWLALSSHERAQEARTLLAERTESAALWWSLLASAKEHLDEGRPLEARQDLGRLAITQDAEAQALALYFGGMTDFALGETARAAVLWSSALAEKPRWRPVRWRLANAYLTLSRLDEAADVLENYSGLLPLQVAALRLEAGGEGAEEAVMLADGVLEAQPDSLVARIWAARAFLAAGDRERASEHLEALLEADLSSEPAAAAELAAVVRESDPAMGTALQERLSAQSDDPVAVYTLARAEAAAGRPEEGRALLEARVNAAGQDEKHRVRLVLATYLDQIGDEDAARLLLELSAAEPDDLSTQLIVLQAASVWEDPSPLGPVIERLASITGRESSKWRIYKAKRELRMLDRDSAAAQQRASSIVIDLSAVLRDDPGNVAALDLAADAHGMLGDYGRAAEQLLQSVRAEPGNAARRLNLIAALTRAGRVEEARGHAAELAEVPVEARDVLRRRAQVLQSFGLAEQARLDWQRLAEQGDPLAVVAEAARMAAEGDAERADALIEELAAQDNLHDRAISDIAAYFAGRGRVERGREMLDRLPEEGVLGPRDVVLARYLFTEGEGEAHARELEALAERSGNGAAWAYAALAWQTLLRPEEVERVVRAGLRVQPEAPQLLALQRLIETRETEPRVSYLAFIRSVLMSDVSPEAEAVVSLIDQRFAERIEQEEWLSSLERIVENAPLSPGAWIGLASAQFAAERDEEARQTLVRGLEALPTNVLVPRVAAQLFQAMEMPEEALAASRELRDRLGRPDYAASVLMARHLVRLGRHNEARSELSPWQDRIAESRRAAPLDALLLAEVLAATGEVNAAHDLLSPLVGSVPEGAGYYAMVSSAIRDEERRRGWLEWITPRALESEGAGVVLELVSRWSEFAARTGTESDIRHAVRVAEEALARLREPRYEVLFVAATGYDALGEPARALPHYQALVRMLPDQAPLHNNLAYAMMRAGETSEEALEHADRAVALGRAAGAGAREMQAYLDTRAQVLLALGQASEACEVYREGLGLDGDWPRGTLGLGEALAASGRLDEARAQLQALASMQLSDEDLLGRLHELRASLEK